MAFEIYKRGQGKYTRLCSAFGVALVAGLGCLQLYKKLEAVGWGPSRRAALWIATMVPAGLFVVFGLLVYWLVNKPSVADFMIAAEGEMKKVSWSSRKEIAVSTLIVIVVVIVMAVILYVTDLSFRMFFDWLLFPTA
ncbi:MAG: preprotein translocase subunit SecE [Planctomycetota bacterium]|jgi:preprotein translocase subunit SecE